MEVDPEEEEPEDLSEGQAGRTYKARTEGGKAMAKMLKNFCRLTEADAHAIIVFFGMYCEKRLAKFQESHWKDTFAQWQKQHMCPDGTERAMVLSPLQQDRIRCAAWACRHKRRLGWPPASISPWDADIQMIEHLSKEHFEAIWAQMEQEEEGKITLKSIPDLTDVPVYRSSVTMLKHFHNFETYLSQC